VHVLLSALQSNDKYTNLQGAIALKVDLWKIFY
jgi:hypothetical protein